MFRLGSPRSPLYIKSSTLEVFGVLLELALYKEAVLDWGRSWAVGSSQQMPQLNYRATVGFAWGKETEPLYPKVNRSWDTGCSRKGERVFGWVPVQGAVLVGGLAAYGIVTRFLRRSEQSIAALTAVNMSCDNVTGLQQTSQINDQNNC